MKKCFYVLIGVMISLGYVGNARADKAFLKALQDTLAKLGNPWIAEETELSNLSFEEKQSMCGVMPVSKEEWSTSEMIEEPYVKKLDPPVSWDWRNKDGENWLTPVKNQGSCGNCWAFAMCGAMEAMIKIQDNTPDVNPNLSEQFLTSCNTKGFSCNSGGNFTAFDDAISLGVCDEACFPYQVNDAPCDNRCSDWASRVSKVSSYRTYFTADVSNTQKKEWIMEGPVCVSIDTKEDFFYYKGGTYKPIMGRKLGGHALLCIGWNSSNNWLCKNSWGANQPYILVSAADQPCWVKMVGTGTPIIQTTTSLDFVFSGAKSLSSSSSKILSPTSSINSEETISSVPLESLLREGESILEFFLPTNSTKADEDTIWYDAGGAPTAWFGSSSWGVKFTPSSSCNVIAGLVGRYTEAVENDKLRICADDAGGSSPGTLEEEAAYSTSTGAKWYRKDFATAHPHNGDFWLYAYIRTSESSPYSYACTDATSGTRSYYYEGQWKLISSSNIMIRAIVTYGGGYAGSDILWVKNVGVGPLAVTNVISAGSSAWISSLSTTSFNVPMNDSIGIEVSVDTSGLSPDVLYTDEIVITSNSGKAETRVPISLIINNSGVNEEQKSKVMTFNLFPNPVRDKVDISYFVSKEAPVKLVICDIAGREVATIVDRVENAGLKNIEWNTKNIPSGIYFCRLTNGKLKDTKKVLLVR